MGMHYRAALQAKFAPPGGGRDMEEGLDGGRDRTAGFLTLIKKGFLFLKRRVCYFNVGTMSSTSTLISVERHQMRTFGLLMWVWLPYCCRLTRDYRILLTQSLFLTIES